MGTSVSVSSSEQSAQAFLAQQYYGSCDVSCQNIQDNTNIDIINSVVNGDINLTQTCSVDANCMVSNSSDATSDVLFKASNSTNAKNASNLFSGSIFNFDAAISESRQNIKQTIIQNSTEKCNMSSLNQMNDVNILAANSTIGGSINISQQGSVQGSCQLGNNFTAAAAATAMASNTATSGKDKKGQKKGGNSALITFLGFVGVMVVVFILAKMFTGGQRGKALTQINEKVALARVKAGCYGGGKPITDPITGRPVIDPRTMGPICPPPPVPSPPMINIGSMGTGNNSSSGFRFN